MFSVSRHILRVFGFCMVVTLQLSPGVSCAQALDNTALTVTSHQNIPTLSYALLGAVPEWSLNSQMPSASVGFDMASGMFLTGAYFDRSAMPLMVEGSRRSPGTQTVGDSSKTSELKWLFNERYSRDRLDLQISLAEDQTVDIALYNILGKKVKDLEHSYMTECKNKDLSYSVSDVPVGVYIVAAQGSNFRAAVRIVISSQQ